MCFWQPLQESSTVAHGTIAGDCCLRQPPTRWWMSSGLCGFDELDLGGFNVGSADNPDPPTCGERPHPALKSPRTGPGCYGQARVRKGCDGTGREYTRRFPKRE